MQSFTYNPPKVKNSTKMVSVTDSKGEIVCSFKRTYHNMFTRIADIFLSHNFFVQFDVFTESREIKYQGNKMPRWGRSHYKIVNLDNQEEYLVSCSSWQTLSPEFLIKCTSGDEFTVKKELMDWAKFYYDCKEAARWKMKTTELFKTYLEIEEHSPIKEPEFFICLFQCIFYIGD
ncbi:hypothetical protein WKH31_18630 [Metabacillus indicus]|uniref:tubby C-terminal domain-like protein n=1 Tax=Metabacillus indicus TaxID=246786 RepID=UPI0031814345